MVFLTSAPKRRIARLYEPILARMDKLFAAYDEKQLGLIKDFFERSNRSRR